MDKVVIELSRLTVQGQCTLTQRIRDYLGVEPGDQVAFVLTEHGVLVKKLVVQTQTATPSLQTPADTLRELVLAVGRDAQRQGLSEEDVEQDISQYLQQQ
jgi:bifunctional DNA-binding transcriptional regulator/antitoxin component of YhaV-PrlF toxin-antitoxin module